MNAKRLDPEASNFYSTLDLCISSFLLIFISLGHRKHFLSGTSGFEYCTAEREVGTSGANLSFFFLAQFLRPLIFSSKFFKVAPDKGSDIHESGSRLS